MGPGGKYFRFLSHYNTWANGCVYDACASLSDREYRRDRKAFFGSIHGTLNHLLVTDIIELARVEDRDHGMRKLDQILHEDLSALRSAHEAIDRRIVAAVEAIGDADLETVRRYNLMNGTPTQTPLGLLLVQLFNHQTHHRGQVHDMLTQAGAEAPPLDVVAYLAETGERREAI